MLSFIFFFLLGIVIRSPDKKHSFVVDNGVMPLLKRFKQKVMKEDQEVWVAFQGDTGVGKSLKAMRYAYAIANKLIPIKHIPYDRNEFIECVIKAKKGDIIIVDEAISTFFNRSSMTKEGRIVAELCNQIRQKNLIIFLCIPDVLGLDYMITKKLNAVVHIWENRQRVGKKLVTLKGNTAIYIQHPELPQVQLLLNFLRGKKRNPLAKLKKPDPMLYEKGEYVTKAPWYPVLEGEAAYKKKKESVLDKFVIDDKESSKQLDPRYELIYKLNQSMSFEKISNILGIPKGTLYDYNKRYKAKMFDCGTNIVDNGGRNGRR